MSIWESLRVSRQEGLGGAKCAPSVSKSSPRRSPGGAPGNSRSAQGSRQELPPGAPQESSKDRSGDPPKVPILEALRPRKTYEKTIFSLVLRSFGGRRLRAARGPKRPPRPAQGGQEVPRSWAGSPNGPSGAYHFFSMFRLPGFILELFLSYFGVSGAHF